jgi:hypothetical protein
MITNPSSGIGITELETRFPNPSGALNSRQIPLVISKTSTALTNFELKPAISLTVELTKNEDVFFLHLEQVLHINRCFTHHLFILILFQTF